MLIAMAIAPAARADGDADIVWTAGKVRGTVSYRESGQEGVRWIPLRAGALLSALAQIKTGPDGHAELSYQGSTIVAAPNSELHLPGPTPKNAVYRVSQNVGTFLYKIKHATRDKFEVQTPYLTTIIKGTVFTVLAGPAGASVHVTEGAVFVRPSSGQGGSFVRPGETARVNGANRDRVTIQGARTNPGRSDAPAEERGRQEPGKPSSSPTANPVNGNAASTANSHKPVKIVFRDVSPRGATRGALDGNRPDNAGNARGKSDSTAALDRDAGTGIGKNAPANIDAAKAPGNSGPGNGNAGLGGGNSGNGNAGLGGGTSGGGNAGLGGGTSGNGNAGLGGGTSGGGNAGLGGGTSGGGNAGLGGGNSGGGNAGLGGGNSGGSNAGLVGGTSGGGNAGLVDGTSGGGNAGLGGGTSGGGNAGLGGGNSGGGNAGLGGGSPGNGNAGGNPGNGNGNGKKT